MFGYIGKLLLSVLGVGSPFIATMYLTNKHKTPTPFLENLEILEMTEIDEQDKLIEEAVAQIKVKKGHSGGGEASDSGGLGSTANSVGSGAKATGESGDIKGGGWKSWFSSGD
ncbi:hypothetical protein [Candidatus Mycoplasma haematohominis]|uniref:hypothetical protein n=1 Tax=Candidatus Mycoplasma haematohominis TaxID=1494318 RepID=UPI001C0A6F05|nr:hypothetical protein [Candidatus Mycoplasma haemohominis]